MAKYEDVHQGAIEVYTAMLFKFVSKEQLVELGVVEETVVEVAQGEPL